jgi:NAD(P)-dependent dehydrogenase (short-subunit alcohol dehydrogenase family)
MSRLQGKVALITVGSSGIGLATAQRFVTEGAFVYIFGLRQSELDTAAAVIGQGVATVHGDVKSICDLDRLFARIREEKGSIDILVANSVFIDLQSPVDTTETRFNKTVGTIVSGFLLILQKALPLISDGGAIVLISSIPAFRGISKYAGYSATKAAVRSFVRIRTAELKDRGIRVNSLGAIDTTIIDAQSTAKEGADTSR